MGVIVVAVGNKNGFQCHMGLTVLWPSLHTALSVFLPPAPSCSQVFPSPFSSITSITVDNLNWILLCSSRSSIWTPSIPTFPLNVLTPTLSQKDGVLLLVRSP